MKNMRKYDVCVVGLGYIGLPTALLFAKSGKKVLGYDISADTVQKVRNGEQGKNEPNLNELLKECLKNGSLTADTKPDFADLYIIAVPTPFKNDKEPDMSYVQSAFEAVLPYIEKGCSVVLESTSPVGSTVKYICEPLTKKGFKPGEDVFVAYSPERVLPGNILFELVHNNRIVGGVSEESCLRVKEYYKLFVKGDIEFTDANTAEMCKLTENAYRDVNIAFANEMAKMCQAAGVNAWEVQKLCNKHPRVNILMPGPGVGGHCIAVDPWFLVSSFPEATRLIATSRNVNDSMPLFAAEQIDKILGDTSRKISILGITYKPDVDDVRESPVLKIAEILRQKGYEVAIHDPLVAPGKYANTDLEVCLQDSDMLVIGVNHKAFKNLDLQKVFSLMRTKVIYDTRNFIDRTEANKAGFAYYLLGCGSE